MVEEVQSFVTPKVLPDDDEHATDVKGICSQIGPLSSDWDIINDIYHNFVLLPGVQIKHVKGHQDGASPYADLSMFAQLNVEADAWAGSYQELHGEARAKVHLLSHAGVQVNLAQGTITYKIHQAVMDQWVASIHNAIDWKVFKTKCFISILKTKNISLSLSKSHFLQTSICIENSPGRVRRVLDVAMSQRTEIMLSSANIVQHGKRVP